LGDLIALWGGPGRSNFAGEARMVVDGAIQRKRGAHGHFDGTFVQDGESAGRPRHTGQTLVFGGSPKRVEHPQKIFVRMRSWTWTSRPMTGSVFREHVGRD